MEFLPQFKELIKKEYSPEEQNKLLIRFTTFAETFKLFKPIIISPFFDLSFLLYKFALLEGIELEFHPKWGRQEVLGPRGEWYTRDYNIIARHLKWIPEHSNVWELK